jgi:hypothetical protein
MSVLSTVCCALLSAVSAFTLVTAGGCGTDAKGVDDCRDIEQARCTAAKNCGIVKDVTECQNYYRDQCLHGLAVSLPTSTVLQQCVATIRAAGVCALQGTDTAIADCANGPVSESTTAKTTCEIVTNPETTAECSFLLPTVDAGTAGSGGAGGSGGSAGSAGSSGASDAATAGGEGGTAG